MQTENLITVTEFCAGQNIEQSFVGALQQYGFIEFTTIEQTNFLTLDELPRLEKIIRLHNDLNINFEGIEAIIQLLEKIDEMETELKTLRNKLSLYER